MQLIERILAANLEEVLTHSSCPDLLLAEILEELGRENERQRVDLIRLRDRRATREEEFWQTQREAARHLRLAEVLGRQEKPEEAREAAARAEALSHRHQVLGEELADAEERMRRLKGAMNRLQGAWMAAKLLRGRFPDSPSRGGAGNARLEMERLLSTPRP